ncbi:LOW QUALITY PROTEIN: protease [Bacillus sp. JCM 19045]|nr:LOW QUALITY PROTEIN: protease [Bacillus sp. JCM 19045]
MVSLGPSKPYSTEQLKTLTTDRVTNASMDHLMAEDIARTTSLLIASLTGQMEKWGDVDVETLTADIAEELNEHPYIKGIAIRDKDNRIIDGLGTLQTVSSEDISFSNQYDGILYSNPYQVNGENHLFVGKKLDNQHQLIGDVDLRFIQSYLADFAAIADSNGTFFVSGSHPNVQFSAMNELPDQAETVSVPGLNWNIVVQSEQRNWIKKYTKHQVVAKLHSSTNIQEWAAKHQYEVISWNRPFIVIGKEGVHEDELVNALRQDNAVLYAEPNFAFANQAVISQAKVEPNDEFFKSYQWNLEQIQVEDGWNLANGADVTIAIIDSGVDSNHIDLKDKLTNGYNAITDTEDYADGNGHGTHVAGIAAAITNNVEGIAGVSWQSNIMPIKVLDDNGEGSSYAVARGIYWAVDNGADVINMSLVDYYHSDVLYDAIEYAYEKDVVLIGASGNENTGDLMYPAAYPQVITVASVNEDQNRSFFSNYGDHVDVAAPGEHIPSTYVDDQYVMLSGTSMASPHVAGLAALLRSVNPSLTNEEVGNLILGNAKQLGDGEFNVYYGYGEIDVNKTLQHLINE